MEGDDAFEVKCSDTVEATKDVISDVSPVVGIFIVTVDCLSVVMISVGIVVGTVEVVTCEVVDVESPFLIVVFTKVVRSSISVVVVVTVSVSPDGYVVDTVVT